MSLVVEQSTWSQEWTSAGPYMFGCLSTCTDVDDGARQFKITPFLHEPTTPRHPTFASNPDLTWLNVEVDKARVKVMEIMYEPASSHDGRRNMDMWRITSLVSWLGAALSWINMRIHTGHSGGLHQGVPPSHE